MGLRVASGLAKDYGEMAKPAEPDWIAALARARSHAPFLARALDRQPELYALLSDGRCEEALAWTRARGESADDPAVALRRQRLGLATTVAIADLAGAFDLARVVKELTDFADRALDTAIRTAISERTGERHADGMIALALGKQGAGELNYSSDIDPILLYDRERLPCRANEDPGEAAQRYARRVIKLLSDNTPEGYVVRVDLRLRPASEISPLVVPVGTARTHYQGQALAWERAAFIRARAAAADIAAGEAFLSEISPFVWRSMLDFGAIEEIRALTLRIRQSNEGSLKPGPGFDVKRGRGGIREVEFFVQTHQLIHGGRDRSLRVKGTRAALDALAAAGRIEAAEAEMLGVAYDRLRTIEHRLQMVGDRQTHSLPDGEALDNVAWLDGLGSGEALVNELTEITARVAGSYDRLIGDPKPLAPQVASPTPVIERIGDLSLPERISGHEQLAERIEGWRDGRYQALRSPQALAAFDALIPVLAKAFVEADDPEHALARWERLLEQASSAINLFHLLKARPALLSRLVSTLTLSPTLADDLGRHPGLLDVLIDDSSMELPGSVSELAALMRQRAPRADYEATLDGIRQVTSEYRFALGVQLIEARHNPPDIACGLSRLAEAAILTAAQAAEEEFARVHGRIADNELVILGLGRLGGGALTHASDLDMIYLFSGDYSRESDGKRPLGGTLYFNRLASRVTAALSVPTAQGALYEVDTRLRPQGNQGPLAVSIEAFEKYQKESAWTWEHMALARARVLVGPDAARARLAQVFSDVLAKPRDLEEVRTAILTMRGEMAEHKPSRGPLDVKLLRGGLVDVEFLVHCLQLQHASRLAPVEPSLLSQDLPEAIRALQRHGLVPEALLPAYLLMTDILVAGRLLAPDGLEPPSAAGQALVRACGRASYSELLNDLAVARSSVAHAWAQTFDQTLETDNE